MDASYTCDMIISQIKSSNLNYCLKESPFSVDVSIKKTFIKDKNGNTKLGPKEMELFYKKIDRNLVTENEALKEDIQYLANEAALENALDNLGLKLDKAKLEIGELIDMMRRKILLFPRRSLRKILLRK